MATMPTISVVAVGGTKVAATIITPRRIVAPRIAEMIRISPWIIMTTIAMEIIATTIMATICRRRLCKNQRRDQENTYSQLFPNTHPCVLAEPVMTNKTSLQ